MIRRHIPNFLTLMNLLMGCMALVMVFRHDFALTAIFVSLAAIFDFFDGLAARALKVTSAIGKELDSLCDVVSFGVVPGFVMYHMITFEVGSRMLQPNPNHPAFYLAWLAFLIPLLSAFRLAKFNLDQRQSYGFIGLPTPANALVIIFFPLAIKSTVFPALRSFFSQPIVLAILCIVFSTLLISNLHLMAFKFKNLSWRQNKIKFIFLIITFLALALLRFWTAPFLLLIYLTLSRLEKNQNPAT